MNSSDVEATIVALERAALDRWCKRDPSGYLDNAVEDVTFCDHLTTTRIMEGIAALKDHVGQFIDKVDVPHYEMRNARVRSDGNIAVLTFNWETYSREGELTSRWNTTEVFVRSVDHRWKYAHLHWAPIITKTP